MKYLVLGSAGQIGSALTKIIKNSNDEVIEFDIVDDISQDLRIYNNSLLDNAVKGVDFVFFLAFDVGGARYLKAYQDSNEFISNNTKIINNTFEVLKKYEKPFIFASSQMSNMSYSNYGRLKALGEAYTKSLNGIIVKFWNVYGLEKDLQKSHVITDLIIKAKKDKKIVLMTDGTEERQFLYADDCCECLLELSKKYEQIPRDEDLHITNFQWNSILDVAKIIAENFPGSVIEANNTSDDIQKNTKNEPNKYILSFWQPKTSLNDGIKKIINLMENSQKTALVCGAGGFIGSHLVKRLKKEGFWVRGVDLKKPEFSASEADDFILADLRDPQVCEKILDRSFDEVYQLAADMGGAGYIFSGNHDADVMHNSATINLNIAYYGCKAKIKKIFYSSSACIYPLYNQLDPENPKCSEDSAYPASPDSEYGWEKLFSERLYFSFMRNYELNVRIARFHNIFGPEGSWCNGKEKAPAAICRKVAETSDGGTIEIWGDGEQTRSFLYIDECLDGIRKLMDSDFNGPANIGSEEMVTINGLAHMAMEIANKKLDIKHIDGPLGVRGRNSDNKLIKEKLNWTPSLPLKQGLSVTYAWIAEEVKKSQKN
jgi:nucleoside-diphosphate-sugar epimerase